MFYFFFFNDTATTEIYTLSLHDALPILSARPAWSTRSCAAPSARDSPNSLRATPSRNGWLMRSNAIGRRRRSEEHTSELQSQSNLVCRLLLEKKKKTQQATLNTHTSSIN